MLQIFTEVVTEFSQNGRIIACSESGDAVIVDPGGEPERFIDVLQHKGLTCKGIWLTHSHLDHCGGVAPLLSELQVHLVAHPFERNLRQAVVMIAQKYGLSPNEWHNCPEPTVTVTGGEELTLGTLTAQVLFTPGHSPGHVSFYFPTEGKVISGDALFAGSIGRTDLPGGDHRTLITSIEEKLLRLPDETVVLSGHGEDTTIGAERRSNPFLVDVLHKG